MNRYTQRQSRGTVATYSQYHPEIIDTVPILLKKPFIVSVNCNKASQLQVGAASSTRVSFLSLSDECLSAGIILRCHIFTENHHLQVLSVYILEGRVLHQSHLSVLQEQQKKKKNAEKKSNIRNKRSNKESQTTRGFI